MLFNTIKYLKFKQVFYQLKYRLRKQRKLSAYNKTYFSDKVCFLSFKSQPPVYTSYLGKNRFTFLNLQEDFGSDINWNYQNNGKLWNYNLQYANYLLQEDVHITERKILILSLYKALDKGKLPLEPYPVSLRAINCIRFFSYHKIADEQLYAFLHAELDFLSKRPEYHLLGNHLLENAFALLMGGAFFSESNWVKQGQAILEEQLQEQIMNDGAHFELSPMYHQIVFFRLLELIDWYKKWNRKEEVFLRFLFANAMRMRSWLASISFSNGDIPHFNDSAIDIAYSTPWLLNYSNALEVKTIDFSLDSSGYRSYKYANYECKVDVAQIGPQYQPGHGHADTLSFIFYYKNKPLFVETGTSTYQINNVRLNERSTSAHNTVTVNGMNQSNVWSGFRVAQRAKTYIINEGKNTLTAKHNGYRKIGVTHIRSFEFNEYDVVLVDTIRGRSGTKNQLHLHLHSTVTINRHTTDFVSLGEGIVINFVGANNIYISDYNIANGYNRYEPAKKIVVTFDESITTTISLNE